MSLRPDIFSFSWSRLQAVWKDPENNKRRGEYELHTLINHDSEHAFPNQKTARKLCLQLYEDVCAPESHVERLDKSYSDTFWMGNLGRATVAEQKACMRLFHQY